MDYKFLDKLKRHFTPPFTANKDSVLDIKGNIVLMIGGGLGIGWKDLPEITQWIADKLNEVLALPGVDPVPPMNINQ